MLSRERLEIARDVMQDVVDNERGFTIKSFLRKGDMAVEERITKEELHTCGYSACVSGYLAFDERVRSVTDVDYNSLLSPNDFFCARDEDDEDYISSLCWLENNDSLDNEEGYLSYWSDLYGGKSAHEVTAEDAVKAIDWLIENRT